MPFSVSNTGASWNIFSSDYSIFNALFTAVSAFTNTGLVTHVTKTTYTFVGQLIILILIQVGGIGFLTILIFLWQFVTRSAKFNVEQRLLLHFERGNNSKSSSLKVVQSGIMTLLITEIVGAIVLTFFFYYSSPLTIASESVTLKGDLKSSIWAGIFHSVSATNNAGFDIIGKSSISPYRAGEGNLLSLVIIIQSFIGGIGYPVFHDIFVWFKNKRKKHFTQITLFSKISLLMYFSVSYVAIFSILSIEMFCGEWLFYTTTTATEWGSWPILNKIWNLIFLTFSSRSAGFSGVEIGDLNQKSQWLLSVLMFIGTSPASTGGGIRSITLFLIGCKIFQIMTGKKYITVFKKNINSKIIEESMIVCIVAAFLITVSSLLIYSNKDYSNSTGIGHTLFESASAFGTVGLSSNVCAQTNIFGKIILLILMFVGQLGISNVLLSWTNSRPMKKNLQYSTENIRII